MAGFVFAAAGLMIFAVDFVIKKESENKVMWICLFVSMMGGILCGYFTMIYRKVGTFLIGGFLGYTISIILYAAFLYKIKSNPPEITLYVSNALFALIFGIVGAILFD